MPVVFPQSANATGMSTCPCHTMPLSADNLPLLLIGIVMAAYWYRVLRMARKQRQRSGRAANLIPAEPLGRVLRVLWAPAIVIWIGHPIASPFWNDPPSAFRQLF